MSILVAHQKATISFNRKAKLHASKPHPISPNSYQKVVWEGKINTALTLQEKCYSTFQAQDALIAMLKPIITMWKPASYRRQPKTAKHKPSSRST